MDDAEPRPTFDPAIEHALALLDELETHPDWNDPRRDAQFDRLIASHDPDELLAAARQRLHDLNGARGEAILQILDAYATPPDLALLATALESQQDLLPPERLWDALALLEATGELEAHGVLLELRDELNEVLFGAADPLQLLVQTLEDDPEEVWIALQGIDAVEPEIRAEILKGLGEQPLSPGLANFLRLLAQSPEPRTRDSAIEALRRAGPLPPALNQPVTPRIVRSLVTLPDFDGRALVLIQAHEGPRVHQVRFVCDLLRGISDVDGETLNDHGAGEFLVNTEAPGHLDLVENDHDLAGELLAGAIGLCGPRTPSVLPYWLERTFGPELQPRPVPLNHPTWNPDNAPFEDAGQQSQTLLNACPQWADRSEPVQRVAQELLLRHAGPPNPTRDQGAYRWLFDHRFRNRLELYHRMLAWAARFFHSAGNPELATSALSLAHQLADPQNAVPSHPFIVTLTTQSLLKAQAAIRKASPQTTP
jgi:hypothetical protein